MKSKVFLFFPFLQTAFEGYARGSEARWLFNVQFAFFPFFG